MDLPTKARATREADSPTAAYWLTHPDASARRKTITYLLDQWESEPEWKDTDEPCPDPAPPPTKC
jgi:hypothetical protein